MRVLLSPGEKIEVEIADSDGVFTIDYNSAGDDVLSVHADMPDTEGREGVIYEEKFGSILPPKIAAIIASDDIGF